MQMQARQQRLDRTWYVPAGRLVAPLGEVKSDTLPGLTTSASALSGRSAAVIEPKFVTVVSVTTAASVLVASRRRVANWCAAAMLPGGPLK